MSISKLIRLSLICAPPDPLAQFIAVCDKSQSQISGANVLYRMGRQALGQGESQGDENS